MSGRPGVSLIETLLVTCLFALVLAALAGFASAQGRLAAALSDSVRSEELHRAARLILEREIRYLAAPDVLALADDSLRLRAIRGGGPVCGGTGTSLNVRYRGVRRPEPEKDSVLLVRSREPGGVAYALRSVAGDTACGGSLRLELDGGSDVAAGLALVFEVGSYHISEGALRYRRGAAGKQPLTEAVLARGGFAASAPPLAPLHVRLPLHPDSLPRVALRDRSFQARPAALPPGWTDASAADP